jgi:hypothetical protein
VKSKYKLRTNIFGSEDIIEDVVEDEVGDNGKGQHRQRRVDQLVEHLLVLLVPAQRVTALAKNDKRNVEC